MSNQWFQFKQFKVQQEACAMKVGTDGVLLGAWTLLYSGKKILDIGTGTGLISLMLAQRYPEADILAIEIDGAAEKQASENVATSDFASQIEVRHCSYHDFLQTNTGSFDLLVCNPPFFVDSLKADSEARSLARHVDDLSLAQLMKGAEAILGETGRLSLILPFGQKRTAVEFANYYHLHLQRELIVFPVPEKQAKRICMQFGKERTIIHSEELIIEDKGRHKYSSKYVDLTKDFYLHF